jgi:excisionase family DNA binding protein
MAVNASRAPLSGERITSDVLTIRDVAVLLKVPTSWIYDRLRGGVPDRLPGYKLGKYWRFRQAEVLAWFDARKV